METTDRQIVFWHRQLPPVSAEVMGEHGLEVTSVHVPGTIARRDDLWDGCYADLMARATAGSRRRFRISAATMLMFWMNPSTAVMTTQRERRGCADASLKCLSRTMCAAV